jgi:hypothetical protein
MPTATLLTTTVFTCLVTVLGCRTGAVEEPVPPGKTIQRTTTIRTPPATPQPADPATIPASKPASPKPTMSVPPTEESLGTPTRSPAPPPTRYRPPAEYVNGRCRPLVA